MSADHKKRPHCRATEHESGSRISGQPVRKARSVIVFGLVCDEGHEFEGWFRSNQDFDDQSSSRKVACPACLSTRVEKGIMAPNLNLSGSIPVPTSRPYGDETDLTDNAETIASLETEIADMRRQIRDELRNYVEENFDDAGADFPAEARRRHYDEVEAGVYGEATVEDMVALIDEGITVAPLPQDPKKLN